MSVRRSPRVQIPKPMRVISHPCLTVSVLEQLMSFPGETASFEEELKELN